MSLLRLSVTSETVSTLFDEAGVCPGCRAMHYLFVSRVYQPSVCIGCDSKREREEAVHVK